MRDDDLPFLVFGATGNQGRSVANALLTAGRSVRAVVRDTSAPASIALKAAGAEIVAASLSDLDTIRHAMIDTRGVFVVMPGNLPADDEVRHGMAIANLAAETGVRHLVYSSGASAGDKPTGVPRFDAKPRIEAHVRQLPITTTIVRPMIFMEMMVRPGFGLDQGKLMTLVRPDQTIQLVAVQDIGRFVTAIFADGERFEGETMTIASDAVTGDGMAEIFSEALGRTITYERLPDAVLASNPDLAAMASSLEDGPLSRHADLSVLRRINPDMLSLRRWLEGSGRSLLEKATGHPTVLTTRKD